MNTPIFPDLVVNGETLPHALVAAEVQNHTAPDGKPGIAWRKAARAIAIRTLLLQEARRAGVTASPRKLGQGQLESDEEALVRGLLDRALTVEPPSEAVVRAEWERDPSRFRAPPLWEVSHILIACDPRDHSGYERARVQAVEVVGQIENDPKGFEHLAKVHSDCASKTSGGFLGQIGPGDTVPEFESALRKLSTGETTTEPILTRYGYHVIRMNTEAKGEPLPFESVKEHIAMAMEKAAWSRAAHAYVSDLVLNAEISGADFGNEARAAQQ